MTNHPIDWSKVSFSTISSDAFADPVFTDQLKNHIDCSSFNELRRVVRALPEMEARARDALQTILLEELGGHASLAGQGVYPMDMMRFLTQLQNEVG